MRRILDDRSGWGWIMIIDDDSWGLMMNHDDWWWLILISWYRYWWWWWWWWWWWRWHSICFLFDDVFVQQYYCFLTLTRGMWIMWNIDCPGWILTSHVLNMLFQHFQPSNPFRRWNYPPASSGRRRDPRDSGRERPMIQWRWHFSEQTPIKTTHLFSFFWNIFVGSLLKTNQYNGV